MHSRRPHDSSAFLSVTPRRNSDGEGFAAARPGDILLYSNEPSPEQRGLVLVDGIDGEIIDSYTETNPEDWTGLS